MERTTRRMTRRRCAGCAQRSAGASKPTGLQSASASAKRQRSVKSSSRPMKRLLHALLVSILTQAIHLNLHLKQQTWLHSPVAAVAKLEWRWGNAAKHADRAVAAGNFPLEGCSAFWLPEGSRALMCRPWSEIVTYAWDAVAEVEKAAARARLAEQAKRNRKKSKKQRQAEARAAKEAAEPPPGDEEEEERPPSPPPGTCLLSISMPAVLGSNAAKL